MSEQSDKFYHELFINTETAEDPEHFLWGGCVLLEMRECDHNDWCIDGITTHPDSRRQGWGTLALQWLSQLADEHAITLSGYIDSQAADGPDNEKLAEWYTSLGFVITKVTNDFGHTTSLIERKPTEKNDRIHFMGYHPESDLKLESTRQACQ